MTDGQVREIRAPWTDGTVSALNRYQAEGWMHPFTCPQDHGIGGVRLLATSSGWMCPVQTCDYRQDWAHGFMAEPMPDALQILRHRAAASTEGAAPMTDETGRAQPLAVGVTTDGRLVVSIGIDVLAFAVNLAGTPWSTAPFKVTDADVAAAEIVQELTREEEDGTTPVHKLLDQAALDAWENGGQGFTEATPESDEAAR